MAYTLGQKIAEKICGVIGSGHQQAPLHAPVFKGREAELVRNCIETGWVSSVGQYVDAFEQQVAEFCQVKRAIAVVNGTSALHICLLLAGVGVNDEVVVPSLTFIATANAVRYTGGWPHFVDVDEQSLGMDPVKLRAHLHGIADPQSCGLVNKRTGRRIAAIVPMHTFGHPSRINELLAVAQEFGIPLVEDAAESMGSYQNGKHTGGFGLLGAISFNGNKIITTGGGGAIITDDLDLAKRAKHLTTTARVDGGWRFVHDEVGFNYRMPNINAALGVAQLEQLGEILEEKRELARRYGESFSDMPELEFLAEPEGSLSNYWLCGLKLRDANEEVLEEVLRATNARGLQTRPVWTPLHLLKPYNCCFRGDLSVTQMLARSLVNIPSGCGLLVDSRFRA